MFLNCRQGSPFYILHKDAKPYVEQGQVVSVTAPMPNIGQLGQPIGQVGQVGLGQPITYSVDIMVKVGEQTMNFQKLPANLDSADFAGNGNLFVSCTREGVNDEIRSMHKQSADVIASIPFHQDRMQVLDTLYAQLNPEVAENEKRQKEMAGLQQQYNDLTSKFNDMLQQNEKLIQQNSELMAELKAERTSSRGSKKD